MEKEIETEDPNLSSSTRLYKARNLLVRNLIESLRAFSFFHFSLLKLLSL